MEMSRHMDSLTVQVDRRQFRSRRHTELGEHLVEVVLHSAPTQEQLLHL